MVKSKDKSKVKSRDEFKDEFHKVYLMKAGIYVGFGEGEVASTDDLVKSLVKSLKDWAKAAGVEIINADYIGINPSNREDRASCSFVCNLVIDTPYQEVSPNQFKFSSRHFNSKGV